MLHERTLVVLLAVFKLMESLCVPVDVLPIGRPLDPRRPLFDQCFQPRGPRTPLLRFSTVLPLEVRALQ